MDGKQGAPAPGFWRYMINPDKSATPQFEQLCLGLAKVIATLDVGTNDELTPPRLAAFYRAVGGNYDSLFLKSSDHALSFMYQTLGCFHSLQPTTTPFEVPRIPCLSPKGFARWQTIQLLLCPEENVEFIQKAVQVWNVPMANGGTYPKYIPKQVFPDRPDVQMEKWHKMVTGKLNQQNYNPRRIKNSPYQSPRIEAGDRRDGYFSNLYVGRPSRPSRSSSRDDNPRAELYRRRSSVPDASPGGERSSHWEAKGQQDARKARSHSAQRSSPKGHSRQRSKTTTAPPGQQQPSESPSSKRHGNALTEAPVGRRPSSGYSNMAYRSPARTPSTVNEDSGSEASSETSQAGRRQRRSDEDRKGRRTSLWVPSFLKSSPSPSHKRRHSSDAGHRGEVKTAPKPPRPERYPPPPRAIKASSQAQQQVWRGPGGAPQWRESKWDKDSPVPTEMDPPVHIDPRAPQIRFPDQVPFEPLTRESSSGSDHRHRSSASDWEHGGTHRRQGPGPPRIATQTGVSGRRYPTPDTMSPIDRQRTHPSRGGVALA